MLSGPADQPEVTTNLIFTTTHALKIETHSPLEEKLNDHLKWFWELQSLGVADNETSVYDKFVQQVKYDGHRYEVSLPWKEHHPALLDHYELCVKRLINLLRRLKQSPQLPSNYDSIIQDQVSKGIVEIVDKPVMNGGVHYLATLMVMDAHKYVLHNGVKETLTQLRSVYWLVRGRQFVRKLIHSCVVCRTLEGEHCRGILPPPLPEFRVVQSRPF